MRSNGTLIYVLRVFALQAIFQDKVKLMNQGTAVKDFQ
jgi:hypothetical protein